MTRDSLSRNLSCLHQGRGSVERQITPTIYNLYIRVTINFDTIHKYSFTRLCHPHILSLWTTSDLKESLQEMDFLLIRTRSTSISFSPFPIEDFVSTPSSGGEPSRCLPVTPTQLHSDLHLRPRSHHHVSVTSRIRLFPVLLQTQEFSSASLGYTRPLNSPVLT